MGEDVKFLSRDAGASSSEPDGNFEPAGVLVPLRTKAEVDAQCDFGDVLVIKARAKSTNAILRVIDNATEASDRRNLSHLRRVIRDEHVPKALVSTDAEKRRLKGSDGFAGLERSQDVFILLCRKSVLAYDLITDLLSELNPCDGLASDQMLQTISVPLSPPSSEQEAGLWSEEYWPTIYKRSNPHGPQHNEIEQAAKQIRAKVWSHMDLAGRIGQASADHGCGESFGAVVVDRSGPAAPIVVAAAGDARWTGQGTRDKSLNGGNAMAHAVMRVIGMIAKKRRACSADAQALESDKDNEEWFAEACLTSLERQVYSASSIAPGGYLCVDMELYVTHEPCVMCCMALLHSRFRKVVFKEQMPNTGGLVAEELFQGERAFVYLGAILAAFTELEILGLAMEQGWR